MNPDDPELTPQEHVQGVLDAYGRTSKPSACAAGENEVGGQCTVSCTSGYAPLYADALTCGATCPSGYTDEVTTCLRAPKMVPADMSGCLSQLSCNENLFMDCMKCPQGGSPNYDCQCAITLDEFTKKTYERTATPLDTCKTGEELKDGVCYAACKAGFHEVGPMCLKD